MRFLIPPLLLLPLAGCVYHIRIPAYPLHQDAPAAAGFIAGAGKAEITPPPGIPMGGHGPGGRVARGYWTRLYARSFYFQNGGARRLALVSCELFAIPAGLRAKVVESVNARERLSPDELIVSATHTHHGPANFASSEIYNSFTGPLPNVDPRLLDFLASRIADAVVESIRDARANAAKRHALRFYEGSAPGIQRNRAIAPFYANPDHPRLDILNASRGLGAHCPDGTSEGCPRYMAVDPTLKLIEVARDGRPSALLIFYAVHPTAMTHDAELYSGDLAGIAVSTLERERACAAGFFNGAEGDISPDWSLQDRDDAMEIARRLSGSVSRLLDSKQFRSESDPVPEVRWKTVANNWRDRDGLGFASRPLAGAAEIGGAEDGRTLFYNYGWRPEARKSAPSGEHGTKEPGLDGPMAGLVESLDGSALARAVKVVRPTRFLSPRIFPERVPVAWARLGSFSLAAIPVEATTAVGWAIRDQTHASAIVGLANEYIGYTASAPEYDLQQYEGASTLLGPQQAATLVRLLTLAQGDSADPPAGPGVPAQTFRAGKLRKNTFGPETLLVRRKRNMVDEDLEPLIPRRLRRMESRIPRIEWMEDPEDDWNTAVRHVWIYSRPAAGDAWSERDNDRGFNFLTVLVEANRSSRRWAALWLPFSEPPAGTEYLFRVRTAGKQEVCSKPFVLSGAAAAAPVAAVEHAACPAAAQ